VFACKKKEKRNDQNKTIKYLNS